jgi:hypothetical protein
VDGRLASDGSWSTALIRVGESAAASTPLCFSARVDAASDAASLSFSA